MSFNLASKSSGAFQKIGDVAGGEIQNLTLDCTGSTSANMKLNNANFIADLDGKKAVIKPVKDGQDGQALGIGFVLSNEGQRINNDEYVKLPAVLPKGITNIPMKAEYYRFGSEVQAGRVAATADFSLTFN